MGPNARRQSREGWKNEGERGQSHHICIKAKWVRMIEYFFEMLNIHAPKIV